jgi:hypothetical protein
MLEMVKMLRLRFRKLFLKAKETYLNKTRSLLVAYRSNSGRDLALPNARKFGMQVLQRGTHSYWIRFEAIGE